MLRYLRTSAAMQLMVEIDKPDIPDIPDVPDVPDVPENVDL